MIVGRISSPSRGSAAPLRVLGLRRNKMSMTARVRQRRQPARRCRLAAFSTDSRSLLVVASVGPGVSANGQLVERSARLGLAIRRSCTSTGKSAVVDGFDDRRRCRSRAGRDWGRRDRRRRSARRARTRCCRTRPQPGCRSAAPGAAVSSRGGGRCQSWTTFGVVDAENVVAVGPFVDGIVQPIEMRPPERLVVRAGGSRGPRDQRDRGLFGGAVRRRYRRRRCRACGPVGRRRSVPASSDDRLSAHWQHAALDRPVDQPVAQLARRGAVVVVVVGDLLQHAQRLRRRGRRRAARSTGRTATIESAAVVTSPVRSCVPMYSGSSDFRL